MPLQQRPQAHLYSALNGDPVASMPSLLLEPSAKCPTRRNQNRIPALLVLGSTFLLIPALLRHPRSTFTAPLQRSRPRTVLAISASPGIGNEIRFLLEAMHLARLGDLDLVVSGLPASIPPHSKELTNHEGSSNPYWDLATLSLALHSGAARQQLPASCGGLLDAVYVTYLPGSQEPQVQAAACNLEQHAEHNPLNTHQSCGKAMLANPPIFRRAPSRRKAARLVAELASLRLHPQLPSGRLDGTRPACVLLDGHSSPRSGRVAEGYLYSFMHFVEPAPRFVAHARAWDVRRLAVLHLPDERRCVVRREGEGRICVSVARRRDGDGVYWASEVEFVDAIARATKNSGSEALYIAASEYVPKKIVLSLYAAFANVTKLAPRVDRRLNRHEQEFEEWELAVRARCFIGDQASAISETVYYKRRTLGLETLWSSVLLGKSHGLEYFADNGPIPLPARFEGKHTTFEEKLEMLTTKASKIESAMKSS